MLGELDYIRDYLKISEILGQSINRIEKPCFHTDAIFCDFILKYNDRHLETKANHP